MASKYSPEKIRDIFSTFIHDTSSDDTDILREGNLSPAQVSRSRTAFLNRVKTYTTANWSGKPTWLSPPNCARFGWENVDINILRCVGCGAQMSGYLPPAYKHAVYSECCKRVETSLRSAHKVYCCWGANPSPVSFLHMEFGDAASELDGLVTRVEGLMTFADKLPLFNEMVFEDSLALHQFAELCKKVAEKQPALLDQTPQASREESQPETADQSENSSTNQSQQSSKPVDGNPSVQSENVTISQSETSMSSLSVVRKLNSDAVRSTLSTNTASSFVESAASSSPWTSNKFASLLGQLRRNENDIHREMLELSENSPLLAPLDMMPPGGGSAEVEALSWFTSACLMALAGWQKRESSSGASSLAEAECSCCFRKLGLWNYFSHGNPYPTDSEDEDEVECRESQVKDTAGDETTGGRDNDDNNMETNLPASQSDGADDDEAVADDAQKDQVEEAGEHVMDAEDSAVVESVLAQMEDIAGGETDRKTGDDADGVDQLLDADLPQDVTDELPQSPPPKGLASQLAAREEGAMSSPSLGGPQQQEQQSDSSTPEDTPMPSRTPSPCFRAESEEDTTERNLQAAANQNEEEKRESGSGDTERSTAVVAPPSNTDLGQGDNVESELDCDTEKVAGDSLVKDSDKSFKDSADQGNKDADKNENVSNVKEKHLKSDEGDIDESGDLKIVEGECDSGLENTDRIAAKKESLDAAGDTVDSVVKSVDADDMGREDRDSVSNDTSAGGKKGVNLLEKIVANLKKDKGVEECTEEETTEDSASHAKKVGESQVSEDSVKEENTESDLKEEVVDDDDSSDSSKVSGSGLSLKLENGLSSDVEAAEVADGSTTETAPSSEPDGGGSSLVTTPSDCGGLWASPRTPTDVADIVTAAQQIMSHVTAATGSHPLSAYVKAAAEQVKASAANREMDEPADDGEIEAGDEPINDLVEAAEANTASTEAAEDRDLEENVDGESQLNMEKDASDGVKDSTANPEMELGNDSDDVVPIATAEGGMDLEEAVDKENEAEVTNVEKEAEDLVSAVAEGGMDVEEAVDEENEKKVDDVEAKKDVEEMSLPEEENDTISTELPPMLEEGDVLYIRIDSESNTDDIAVDESIASVEVTTPADGVTEAPAGVVDTGPRTTTPGAYELPPAYFSEGSCSQSPSSGSYGIITPEEIVAARVELRNKRNLDESAGEDGVQESPMKRLRLTTRLRRPERQLFDAVTEHHSWCPWVLEIETISSQPQPAGVDEFVASWRRLLDILVPPGGTPSGTGAGTAVMPSEEGTSPSRIQRIRHLISSWQSSMLTY